MGIEITGAARVLDTYQAPSARTFGPPAGGNQWQELAQGLSNLNPALNQYLVAKRDEQTEKALAEGAALQEQHRVAFRDAVRKGIIPEGANPFLRLGYLKSELRVKGTEYQAFLMDAWSNDGAIRNADVEQLPDWAAQKTQQFKQEQLGQYDPRLVQDVFEPAVQAAQNQLQQRHIAYAFQRNEEQARLDLQQEVATILQTAPDDAARLQAVLNDAVANGINGSDVNKIAIQQIGTVADLTGDRDVLSLLDQINTGNGKLGNTTDARQMKLRIEDRITNRELREEEHAWRMQQRQETIKRKADLSAFYSTAYNAFKTDGLAAVDPFQFIEDNNITDPETQADVIQTSKAMIQSLDRNVADDDQFINKLTEDMNLDPNFDPRRISGGLTDGRYDTPRALQLWQDYRSIASHEDNDLLKSEEFRTIRSGVRQSIGGGLDVFGEQAFNARRAESDLMRYARRFISENPNASMNDFEDAMWKRSERLVKFYGDIQEQDLKRFQAAQGSSPAAGNSEAGPAPAQSEAPSAFPPPPPEAIQEFLTLYAENPDLAQQQFDAVFGSGASADILLQKGQ